MCRRRCAGRSARARPRPRTARCPPRRQSAGARVGGFPAAGCGWRSRIAEPPPPGPTGARRDAAPAARAPVRRARRKLTSVALGRGQVAAVTVVRVVLDQQGLSGRQRAHDLLGQGGLSAPGPAGDANERPRHRAVILWSSCDSDAPHYGAECPPARHWTVRSRGRKMKGLYPCHWSTFRLHRAAARTSSRVAGSAPPEAPAAIWSAPTRAPWSGRWSSPRPDDVDAAVAGSAGRLSGLARARPIKERTQPLFRFRELLLDHLDELANTGRARGRQDAGRGARRASPRASRSSSSRSALQNLDDGGALEVSRGVTLRDAARAARRGRRHHAVQLPGDGAAVDVPDRGHAGQRLHPEAVGEGADDRDAARAS